MGIKTQLAAQDRKKKQSHHKRVCCHCLKGSKGSVCADPNHLVVGVNYRARVPKVDASKKEWRVFIEMFLEYNPKAKERALLSLERRSS